MDWQREGGAGWVSLDGNMHRPVTCRRKVYLCRLQQLVLRLRWTGFDGSRARQVAGLLCAEMDMGIEQRFLRFRILNQHCES